MLVLIDLYLSDTQLSMNRHPNLGECPVVQTLTSHSGMLTDLIYFPSP